MTRIFRIGPLGGAALTGSALTGAAAAMLAGTATTPAPDKATAPEKVADRATVRTWARPTGLVAIDAPGLVWSTRGETGMLSAATALATLTTPAAGDCPRALRRHVAVTLPIGDPLALAQRGARVTVRYHILRDHGWVNADVRVFAHGVHADEMLASSRQEASLVVPIGADMLARDRGVTLDIFLRACARRGGRGTVSLDTIEVAAR